MLEKSMGLMDGKRGLVVGIANERSFAYSITDQKAYSITDQTTNHFAD